MQKINGKRIEDVFEEKLHDYIGKTPKKNGEPRIIEGYYTIYPILKNEDVYKWISARMNKYSRSGKDPKNFKMTNYLNALQRYIDFYDDINDPSELLKEDVDQRNNRLLNYLGELIRDGINQATVRNNYQSRIKSFYSARGSPISDGLPTLDSGINDNEVILDKESIILIQNKLHRPEYKLILKFMALCGLRIGDVLNELTSSRNGEPKYKLRKFKRHYYIDKFWTSKENIIINFLFIPIELSNLLKATYNTDDLEQVDLRTILKTRLNKKTDKHSRINSYDVIDRIKAIAEELEIHENVKNHSFRKYFSNQISSINLLNYNAKIGADFENTFKEHLMGYKLRDLSNAYKQKLKDINQFYELWKPIERAIGIDYEIIDETNIKVKEMSEKYENLEAKYEELINTSIKKDKEIAELKTNIDQYTKDMLSIIEQLNNSKIAKRIDKISEDINQVRERIKKGHEEDQELIVKMKELRENK